MGTCTAGESDVGTLCCHQKPADVPGSWNSETVQPHEWSTVLVPNALRLFTQVLHPSGEVFGYPTENLLLVHCPKENLECGLDQNVQRWPKHKDRKACVP